MTPSRRAAFVALSFALVLSACGEPERPPEPAEAAGEVPSEITLHLDGATHRVPYKPGQSVLEAAQNAELPRNLEALRTLQEKYKVQIEAFPADVLQQLRQFTKQTLNEEAEKDATFKKVYDAYSAFRKTNDSWSSISEAAYAKALAL